jgi:hypothetical protein
VTLLALRLLAVYFGAAAGFLWLAHRFVRRLRPAVALAIAFGPFVLAGKALLTGGIWAPMDIAFHEEPFVAHRAALGIPAMPRTPNLSDISSQDLPWRKALREAVREGRWPLWDRCVLAGTPLLARPVPLFHPGTWIGFLLPLGQAWTFDMALRFLLPLLFGYLFFRDLECGELAAFLGGFAWAFSDFLVFWSGYRISPATAPFPLLLLGLRRLARDADRRAAGITVAALFLILHAGHFESVLHVVCAAGLYFLFALGRADRGRRWKPVWVSLVVGGLALGLGAVLLLPFSEVWPQTIESANRANVYAHVTKSVPLAQSLARAATFLVPHAHGLWGHGAFDEKLWEEPVGPYAGALLLPLALLGAWRSSRKEKWVFVGYVVLGLGVFARLPVLADAVGALPLFKIALNQRLAFLAAFGLSALAALGAQRLAVGQDRSLFAGACVFWAGALGLLAAQFHVNALRLGMPLPFLRQREMLLVAPVALAAAAAMAFTHRRPVSALAIILVVFVWERRAEDILVYPIFPAGAFYPYLTLLDPVPRGQPWRMAGAGQSFTPNVSAIYGVEDVRGYEATNLLRLYETYELWCVPQPVWFNHIDDPTRPFLSFLNVRYLIAPPGWPAPAGWQVIAADVGGRLLENPKVLPRAFSPGRVAYVKDRDPQLAALRTVQEFGDFAVVERGDDSPGDNTNWQPNGPARVAITVYRPQSLSLAIEAEKPAVVVTSIPGWKGWKLRLDGRSAGWIYVNRAFVGFRVPAGRHTAELAYRPDGFVYGALTSAVSLLVCLVLTFRASPRAPGEPAPEAPPPA